MSESHEFDWHNAGDAEDIAIPQQQAVAIYNNVAGDVVIRQAGLYDPSEDAFVHVSPRNALALVKAILDKAGLDLVVVPLTALRITNGGGEVLAPFPDQVTIDKVEN